MLILFLLIAGYLLCLMSILPLLVCKEIEVCGFSPTVPCSRMSLKVLEVTLKSDRILPLLVSAFTLKLALTGRFSVMLLLSVRND